MNHIVEEIVDHIKGPLSGYPTKEWVRQVVLPNIKRDPITNTYLFPDPLKDFAYHSHLHSWYKHLRYQPIKFYPCLRIGKEQRVFPVKDSDTSLHWCFIPEGTVFGDAEIYGGYHYSKLPMDIIKNHTIHLTETLSSWSTHHDNMNRQLNNHITRCLLVECFQIRDHIIRILLEIDPNPPSPEHITIHVNNFLDTENPNISYETETITIKQIKYEYICEIPEIKGKAPFIDPYPFLPYPKQDDDSSSSSSSS